MIYYVYYLIDPITGKIFYIGKGCKRRMYRHVDAIQRGRIPNKTNIKFGNKIKKILLTGYKVKYKKVFITENEKEAYDKEKELIQEIGLENICNLTNGGEGGDTHSMLNEKGKREKALKQSISMKKLLQKNPRPPMSEEQKKKISKTLEGHIRSSKSKEKQSNKMKKIWETKEHREKINKINLKPEHKKKLSEINKKSNWWKDSTEEQRKKHSEAVSNNWKHRKELK